MQVKSPLVANSARKNSHKPHHYRYIQEFMRAKNNIDAHIVKDPTASNRI